MRWALLSQVWVEEAEGTVTGSSVQVYYLAQELVRRGEEVLVLLSGHRRAWERTEGRLRLVSLPAYSAGLWGWLQPRWQRDAEAVLRAFRPDVVYQRGSCPRLSWQLGMCSAQGRCLSGAAMPITAPIGGSTCASACAGDAAHGGCCRCGLRKPLSPISSSNERCSEPISSWRRLTISNGRWNWC